MPNTFTGKRETDGYTLSNGVRAISSASGIIAIIAMIWLAPAWVTGTDNKIAACTERLEALETTTESIEDLKIDTAVMKERVESLSEDVQNINRKITEVGRKQDELIKILLNKHGGNHED